MQHKTYLLNSVAFEDIYSTHFPNGFEAIIKFNIILTEVIKYMGGWDVCARATHVDVYEVQRLIWRCIIQSLLSFWNRVFQPLSLPFRLWLTRWLFPRIYSSVPNLVLGSQAGKHHTHCTISLAPRFASFEPCLPQQKILH